MSDDPIDSHDKTHREFIRDEQTDYDVSAYENIRPKRDRARKRIISSILGATALVLITTLSYVNREGIASTATDTWRFGGQQTNKIVTGISNGATGMWDWTTSTAKSVASSPPIGDEEAEEAVAADAAPEDAVADNTEEAVVPDVPPSVMPVPPPVPAPVPAPVVPTPPTVAAPTPPAPAATPTRSRGASTGTAAIAAAAPSSCVQNVFVPNVVIEDHRGKPVLIVAVPNSYTYRITGAKTASVLVNGTVVEGIAVYKNDIPISMDDVGKAGTGRKSIGHGAIATCFGDCTRQTASR